MRLVLVFVSMIAVTSQAAAQGSAGPVTCTITQAATALPKDVRETSGLALGSRPGVMWTHNDGNVAHLYAVGEAGQVHAQLPISGVRLQDWEDIESGVCDGGFCLYAADIGDNDANRSSIAIHEILEPALSASQLTVRRTIQAVYADGAQDAEAMFRTSNGDFYIVTKGRHRGVALYRLHPAELEGAMGTLRLVRQLAAQPADQRDRVTAATASPNGEWVAIRTYRTLDLYRTADLLNNGAPAITFSLTGLQEKQGESVTLDNAGNLWTTSEAEKSKDAPTMAKLSCAIPR